MEHIVNLVLLIKKIWIVKKIAMLDAYLLIKLVLELKMTKKENLKSLNIQLLMKRRKNYMKISNYLINKESYVNLILIFVNIIKMMLEYLKFHVNVA